MIKQFISEDGIIHCDLPEKYFSVSTRKEIIMIKDLNKTSEAKQLRLRFADLKKRSNQPAHSTQQSAGKLFSGHSS